MRTVNDALVASLTATTALFHRAVADLKPTEWHYQPVAGMNTVAWIIGHVTLIDHRRTTALGATGLPVLPDGFADRYGQTRKPAVTQTGLDSAALLTALFLQTRERFVAAARTATLEKLSEPLTAPHPLFADLGESVLFVSGPHAALHIGQITVIRRLLGYPPVA